METSASSSNSVNMALTGKRPMNSGIRPNFERSSGSIPPSFSITDCSASDFSEISPIGLLVILFSMILSSPTKAPAQIKRIFFVST